MYRGARNNHAPELGNQRQVIKIIMVLVKMIIVGAPDKATSSRFPPFLNIYGIRLVRGARALLKGLKMTCRSRDGK